MTDDRDLVIRLREYRMDVDSPNVVSEAADEIERLRAELVIRRAIGYRVWIGGQWVPVHTDNVEIVERF